jgi:hypothetical protein
MRKRGRISLAKEKRIWQLRCQGYDLDSLGRIVNSPVSSCGSAIYRASKHWKHADDPRLGRRAGWLSDLEIQEIRALRQQGWTLAMLSEKYPISASSLCRICLGRTYENPSDDETLGYNYSWGNRLLAR